MPDAGDIVVADSLIQANCRIIVPEITDYELRRELLRAGKTAFPDFSPA